MTPGKRNSLDPCCFQAEQSTCSYHRSSRTPGTPQFLSDPLLDKFLCSRTRSGIPSPLHRKWQLSFLGITWQGGGNGAGRALHLSNRGFLALQVQTQTDWVFTMAGQNPSIQYRSHSEHWAVCHEGKTFAWILCRRDRIRIEQMGFVCVSPLIATLPTLLFQPHLCWLVANRIAGKMPSSQIPWSTATPDATTLDLPVSLSRELYQFTIHFGVWFAHEREQTIALTSQRTLIVSSQPPPSMSNSLVGRKNNISAPEMAHHKHGSCFFDFSLILSLMFSIS